MIRKIGFIILLTQLVAFCSGRFVKREELKFLHEKYQGDFILKKKVDVGNNETMKAGTKVKVYFRSDSESVKVYAYKANEPREQAMGKNIIYLFETDFPDEEYDRKIFLQKLDAVFLAAR